MDKASASKLALNIILLSRAASPKPGKEGGNWGGVGVAVGGGGALGHRAAATQQLARSNLTRDGEKHRPCFVSLCSFIYSDCADIRAKPTWYFASFSVLEGSFVLQVVSDRVFFRYEVRKRKHHSKLRSEKCTSGITVASYMQ